MYSDYRTDRRCNEGGSGTLFTGWNEPFYIQAFRAQEDRRNIEILCIGSLISCPRHKINHPFDFCITGRISAMPV
jgi:hypothetical protein